MATLTGNTIASTYTGLLSVTGAVGADTVEAVTDGAGTSTSLSLSQQRATITLGSGAGDDFIVDGTTLVVEGDNNRVGIGTASPQQDFVISNGGVGGIEFNAADATCTLNTIRRDTGAYIDFLFEGKEFTVATGTSPAESMRINSSGDVILKDGSGAEDRFLFDVGGAGDNPKFIVYNNDGSTEDFKIDNGTITSVSGATFGGNVGIGASPGANLDVAGGQFHLGTNGASDIYMSPDDTNEVIRFSKSAGGNLDILSNGGLIHLNVNGNVGINKGSPLTKLHIVGATGNPATSSTTPTAIARFDSTYNAVLDIGQGADPYPMWIQAADRSNLAQTYHINMQPVGGNVGIGNFSDGTVHTGTTADERLQVVKYGVSVDSTIHMIQKWSTGFSGSEKGSNFGIGLNRWQDPGNNYPRTKATFYTTGRTNDSDAIPTAVMSINDSGTFITAGTHTASGSPDYAEYFESKDGKAIPFGTTVKLDGDKVVPCENGDTPIGVISADPSVIAGGAEFEWRKRWLVDDYGKKLIGEDGNEIENPDYDDTIEYIPRDEREEWNVVGIMGQLPITKGQPIASNWIKMKDISDTVELWFVK